MIYQKQIQNIISFLEFKYNNKPLNIAYESNRCLFDKIISEINNINLISREAAELPGIYVNGLISNTPLHITQNQQEYLEFNPYKKILFYHNKPYGFLKKEDISILNNHVKDYINIGFTQDAFMWNIKGMQLINYGLQKNILNFHNSNKNKDILVLNLNNNNTSDTIYKQIIGRYNSLSVDMLTDHNLKMEEYYSTISSYKVVLDFSSSYNQLVSAALGCLVVSGNKFLDNKYIIHMSNSKDIIDSIPLIINKYSNSELKSNAENIIEQYPFDKFEQNILNIFNN